MRVPDRIKQGVWRVISPVFPYLRDTLLFFRVIRHNGRQPYRLGWLASGKKLKDFEAYLATKGFDNHFIAWVDEGEVIGLRRRENFTYQYHLRVFIDGEIRGHYEFTPESHPFKHFVNDGMEKRRDEFFSFLKEWVVKEKPLAETSPLAFKLTPRKKWWWRWRAVSKQRIAGR